MSKATREIPRIAITPGEPAGIGPDLCVMLAQQDWPVELVVIADENLMLDTARRLNLPLELFLYSAIRNLDPDSHAAG